MDAGLAYMVTNLTPMVFSRFGFSLVAALCVWLSQAAQAQDCADWMGRFDPHTSLANLSIPGTHDSGATRESFPGTTKCQNLGILEQLNAGVRYLDIRCHPIKGHFAIYHGPVDQHLTFEKVLSDCSSFLRLHTNECVLMAVQEEEAEPNEDPHLFETIFDRYILANRDKWCLRPWIPTLGQARGKIVLIRRFNTRSLPKGIDATHWTDNSNSLLDCGTAKIAIQDQYQVGNARKKWNAVVDFFGEAAGSHFDWLFINYTSGYEKGWLGVPRIRSVSNVINPLLINYFAPEKKGRFGIIAMDFVTPSMSAMVVGSNP